MFGFFLPKFFQPQVPRKMFVTPSYTTNIAPCNGNALRRAIPVPLKNTGHENCVKALLEKKANPNLMNHRRVSALFVAAMNGHTGIAKDLLNAGADMDAKSSDNLSAYEIAKRNGRRHIYDMMDKIRSEK